jgi:two-component system sensor histidine kinase RegB
MTAPDAAKHTGAIVEVKWPRDTIDARHGSNAIPLGENQRFLG